VKTFLRIFLFLFVFASGIFFFRSQLYRFHTEKNLSHEEKELLIKNASLALQSKDVPVGALLVYNDTVLSSGYNTVLRDSNAGGHAEINAISNAIKKIGLMSFSQLDRDQLILLTSFEPCEMCKGAILEYHISHVYFMKGKGIFHWIKNDAKQLRYEWMKNKSAGEEIQDSLFMLHPLYKAKHSS
jgi:tRNA(Arg) A34 adenosine deaminase TadA